MGPGPVYVSQFVNWTNEGESAWAKQKRQTPKTAQRSAASFHHAAEYCGSGMEATSGLVVQVQNLSHDELLALAFLLPASEQHLKPSRRKPALDSTEMRDKTALGDVSPLRTSRGTLIHSANMLPPPAAMSFALLLRLGEARLGRERPVTQ